jgi:hypothetical protein
MSDRELLEMAAKAAGLIQPGWVDLRESGGWNPLADDGDALRLAVKLEMNVFHAASGAYAIPFGDGEAPVEERASYKDSGGDPYAATRRAIVRAAAAIGKEML